MLGFTTGIGVGIGVFVGLIVGAAVGVLVTAEDEALKEVVDSAARTINL